MDELLERSMEEMHTRKKPLAEASIDDNLESKLQWLLVFGDFAQEQIPIIAYPGVG